MHKVATSDSSPRAFSVSAQAEDTKHTVKVSSSRGLGLEHFEFEMLGAVCEMGRKFI